MAKVIYKGMAKPDSEIYSQGLTLSRRSISPLQTSLKDEEKSLPDDPQLQEDSQEGDRTMSDALAQTEELLIRQYGAEAVLTGEIPDQHIPSTKAEDKAQEKAGQSISESPKLDK